MDIYNCSEFDRFISYWSHIILSLTIKKSFLNHVAGALIQVYPALMLQQISTDRALNIEALSKRLNLWQEGRFDEILTEALFVQRELNRIKKIKPSAADKKNIEKLRFIKAVRVGDIRGATRTIDPDNFGVLEWNEDVKNKLSSKFPTSKIQSRLEV